MHLARGHYFLSGLSHIDKRLYIIQGWTVFQYHIIILKLNIIFDFVHQYIMKWNIFFFPMFLNIVLQ